MKKLNKSRDEVLNELRNAYEGGASIRTLVATHWPLVRFDPQHAA